jgi:hypothetical protein
LLSLNRVDLSQSRKTIQDEDVQEFIPPDGWEEGFHGFPVEISGCYFDLKGALFLYRPSGHHQSQADRRSAEEVGGEAFKAFHKPNCDQIADLCRSILKLTIHSSK